MDELDIAYDKLYESVILKERVVKLRLINVQGKLLNIFIYKPDDSSGLRIDIINNFINLTTITFELLQITNITEEDKLFKHIFKIIEETYFCNQPFCDQYIVDNDDLIDEQCISCYIKNKNKKKLSVECSICLEHNDSNSVILNCSHIFHKDCLYKSKVKRCYKHVHIVCPNCRTKTKLNLAMEEFDNESECDD